MNGLTRRVFLRRAGGLALLAAVPAACGGNGAQEAEAELEVQAKGQQVAYLLSTNSAGCDGPKCSCKACAKHAANKLFKTREAADSNRAHLHCDCVIVPEPMSQSRWKALFRTRDVVNRRDPRIAAILS